MDRATWLEEQRRRTLEAFDARHAPAYDENWGIVSPSHRRWVSRLAGLCLPASKVLDAGCGTGKYFGLLLQAGLEVTGTDQSAQMLMRAHAKYPSVRLEKTGLQELGYVSVFDAAICVDAMEYVFPEDWPLVAGNLSRALRPGGHLYLTVEVISEAGRQAAFAESSARGLPVVPGEDADGGYHYYPAAEQVRTWLDAAGLAIIGEDEGDDYWHLLTQRG
jgi:SAM-dependent methyltransferase